MRTGFLIGGLMLAVAIIALWQIGSEFFGNSEDEVEVLPAPQPIVEIVEPPAAIAPVERSPEQGGVVTPPSAPELILPELNDSDAFIKEALAIFALPAAWLDREDLLRRLAVVVDNAARGEYPRRQLSFLAPAGKFAVIENAQALGLGIRHLPYLNASYQGHHLARHRGFSIVAGWCFRYLRKVDI